MICMLLHSSCIPTISKSHVEGEEGASLTLWPRGGCLFGEGRLLEGWGWVLIQGKWYIIISHFLSGVRITLYPCKP